MAVRLNWKLQGERERERRARVSVIIPPFPLARGSKRIPPLGAARGRGLLLEDAGVYIHTLARLPWRKRGHRERERES